MYPLQNLPRAQIPTPMLPENPPSKFTIPRPPLGRTVDDAFFQELEETLREPRQPSIRRPDTPPTPRSLPSDVFSIGNSYDPIDELDKLIDNGDIAGISFTSEDGTNGMINPSFNSIETHY